MKALKVCACICLHVCLCLFFMFLQDELPVPPDISQVSDLQAFYLFSRQGHFTMDFHKYYQQLISFNPDYLLVLAPCSGLLCWRRGEHGERAVKCQTLVFRCSDFIFFLSPVSTPVPPRPPPSVPSGLLGRRVVASDTRRVSGII